MDRKKWYDKMGMIPTQLMVAYLEINAFPMKNHCFLATSKGSCQPLSLHLHGLTQNATEWKIKVFSMDLKP